MPGDMFGDLDVLREFIAPGRGNRPGTKITATTVTIHNTDNTRSGADAKAHSRFVRNTGFYMWNGRRSWVSWHFTVDDENIIQHLPIDEVAYHAGSQANRSSVAIEICMHAGIDEAKANANAADLAAHLLAELGLGVGALRRHKDWTGKNCPSTLLGGNKWSGFVAAVRTRLNEVAGASASLAAAAFGAERTIHPMAEAEDYDTDHDALADAVSGGALTTPMAIEPEVPGDVVSTRLNVRAFGPEVPGDLGDALRSMMAGLAAGGLAAPQLFPNGVIELNLTLPNGASVALKGPARGAQGGGALEAAAGHEGHDHGRADDGDDESSCSAPSDDSNRSLAANAEPINVDFPRTGSSHYTYGRNDHRFGRASTVRAMLAIADAYFERTGVKLGVGHLSLLNGVDTPDHKSHMTGLEVDVRPPRRDSVQDRVTISDPAYSPDRARILVEIIRSNSILPVHRIFFNDTSIPGVRFLVGHDNHLHIAFGASAATGLVADAGSQRSYAQPRSGAALDTTLGEVGYAKVLVKLNSGATAGARALTTGASRSLAEGAVAAALDSSFEDCFEALDDGEAGVARGLAASVGESMAAEAPRPPVLMLPRLGLAIGTVSVDKIEQLRSHQMTSRVDLAPDLRLIRPMTFESAKPTAKVEWGLERLGIPKAWRAGFDGSGVVVGHLDTGVDASHPALKDAIHAFMEFDRRGYPVPGSQARDSGNHGTHTAGTIAGRPVNGRAAIGVAPGCMLASAMVIEWGDVITRILNGLEWIVERDAKVLGMSLGLEGYTDAFEVVVQALLENDVVPVIAVGNEGMNRSRSPGNYSGVLSVGAMARGDIVADFSGSQRFRGTAPRLVPSLVAPGVDG